MSVPQWEIYHPEIGKQRVMGFTSPKRGRRHALNHFLNPAEHWEQLRPEVEPRSFSLRLRQEDCHRKEMLEEGWENNNACSAILDEACHVYVNVVKNHTAGRPLVKAAFFNENKKGSYCGPTIMAVSVSGIFSVFRKDKVSDILTAYRPEPKVTRRELSPHHYQLAAINHFNNKQQANVEFNGPRKRKAGKRK